MKTFRANSSQRGFTLVELMIAMLIGVFLTGGILQIFASSKQAYRLQENLSRLQENGRFAMDFITKDVRMAGYVGCASKITPNSLLDPTKITIPPALTTGIFGINFEPPNKWTDAACGTPNECIPGTDVISFQSASSCGGKLDADASGTAQISIKTPNSCGLGQNDVAIVSDCTHADIFSVVNNPGDGSMVGNGKQNFSHGAGGFNCVPKLGDKDCINNSSDNRTYKKDDAEIFSPRLFSYYIRTGAGGLPALWRVDNSKAIGGTNPVELIEGIENMQIVYGVDTDRSEDNDCDNELDKSDGEDTNGNGSLDDGDYVPNYYVDAQNVPPGFIPSTCNKTGWNRVVSVRITLLAATIDNSLTFSTKADGTQTSQPYTYNGTVTTPADTDRRIRREFSSTIAVRNRLP